MGWRDGLMRLLSRGEEKENRSDADDWCELVTVPQFEAPLLVHRLEANDIEVTQQESFDLVTKTLSQVTILVRRAQLTTAQELTAS
ncbi:MAG: hypothetical protein GX643_08245 [Acidimicrobiales bacterium]|nr:hypothetical protein [Acidimicrobiales bacterium]